MLGTDRVCIIEIWYSLIPRVLQLALTKAFARWELGTGEQ